MFPVAPFITRIPAKPVEIDGYNFPASEWQQIFLKMDLDKNGVISEYEFINGCLQDKFLYQMLTADYSESF